MAVKSNKKTVTFDLEPPSVVLSSNAVDPFNVSPFTVTMVWSESVSGFSIEDVYVFGAGGYGSVTSNLQAFISINTYEVDIAPANQGQVYVQVGKKTLVRVPSPSPSLFVLRVDCPVLTRART
eukprot:2497992-Pyramimonas_sp.AAC.1